MCWRINGQGLHQTTFPFLHVHRRHFGAMLEEDGPSQICAEPRRMELPQRSRFVVRNMEDFPKEASILHRRKPFAWLVETYSQSRPAVRSLDELEKQQHHLRLQLLRILATEQAPASKFKVVYRIGRYIREPVAWRSSQEMLIVCSICTAPAKKEGTPHELKMPSR